MTRRVMILWRLLTRVVGGLLLFIAWTVVVLLIAATFYAVLWP